MLSRCPRLPGRAAPPPNWSPPITSAPAGGGAWGARAARAARCRGRGGARGPEGGRRGAPGGAGRRRAVESGEKVELCGVVESLGGRSRAGAHVGPRRTCGRAAGPLRAFKRFSWLTQPGWTLSLISQDGPTYLISQAGWNRCNLSLPLSLSSKANCIFLQDKVLSEHFCSDLEMLPTWYKQVTHNEVVCIVGRHLLPRVLNGTTSH